MSPDGTVDRDSWSFSPPTEELRKVWVPKRFGEAIFVHVAKNHVPELATSLMMTIQGPMGEGKSFMARASCSQHGFNVVPLSGAMLSGSHENEAVQVLQSAYCYASVVRQRTGGMTVLLIDDFDLSVASAFTGRRYTVNTQLLSGFLMNLADDPSRCGGRRTTRVPIILTGNNFESLHEPLVRHGRMSFFEWKPTLEDRGEIIKRLFEPVLHSRDVANLQTLTEAFPEEPMSFFSAVKDDLMDSAILETYTRIGRFDMAAITNSVACALREQRLDTLFELARLRHARAAKSYMSRTE